MKISKIMFLVKLSKKISILVKIFENFQNVVFSKIFEKFRFWSKFMKISIFGQNFLKFRKISILVKNSKNYVFGQNFKKKKLILIKIFENSEKCRF